MNTLHDSLTLYKFPKNRWEVIIRIAIFTKCSWAWRSLEDSGVPIFVLLVSLWRRKLAIPFIKELEKNDSIFSEKQSKLKRWDVSKNILIRYCVNGEWKRPKQCPNWANRTVSKLLNISSWKSSGVIFSAPSIALKTYSISTNFCEHLIFYSLQEEKTRREERKIDSSNLLISFFSFFQQLLLKFFPFFPCFFFLFFPLFLLPYSKFFHIITYILFAKSFSQFVISSYLFFVPKILEIHFLFLLLTSVFIILFNSFLLEFFPSFLHSFFEKFIY